MPLEQANGIAMYYESSGEGDPLVFVPGLGGSVELWALQTRYFSSHYRCIAVDNRGAGRSDAPEGPYTMAMMATDLRDLLDRLDIQQPVHLVGASMGGVLVQNFIHLFPERVRSLSLVCTGVSPIDPRQTPCSRYVFDKMENPGETMGERADTYLEVFYHPSFVASRPGLRDLFVQRPLVLPPPHAYAAQLAALIQGEPTYDWLAEVQVPALVMHGRDDVVWPLPNALTLAEGLGERGRLEVIDQSAHMLMQEAVVRFNEVLHDFLQQVP